MVKLSVSFLPVAASARLQGDKPGSHEVGVEDRSQAWPRGVVDLCDIMHEVISTLHDFETD